MIRTLLSQVKEYKSPSLLTPFFTGLEVLLEVLIPFVTASIIDKGIEAGNMGQVFRYGSLMLVMAFLSLLCGILAGCFAAKASAGLACDLRDAMYEKVQTFAFSNIDKYSAADAGMQHDHVLFYQRPAQFHFPHCHSGSGCRPNLHYDPDHSALQRSLSTL